MDEALPAWTTRITPVYDERSTPASRTDVPWQRTQSASRIGLLTASVAPPQAALKGCATADVSS